MLEQARQHLAGAPGITGGLKGVFHLPQDLGFTEHQRIETAGD